MATNEFEFLGRDGTEQLVATVKNLLNDKQDKGPTTLIDRTTGKTYVLYVDNGKLHMEEATE